MKEQPRCLYDSTTRSKVAGLAAGALPLFAAALAHAVTLSIDTEDEVVVGSPIQVTVVVEDLGAGMAPSVGIFDLDITFDPDLLDFQDGVLDPTGQLDLSGTGSITLLESEGGEVNLFGLSFDQPSVLDGGQAGEFVLASLTFEPLDLGTGAFDISINALGDAQGERLPADTEGAAITVSPPTVEKVSGDNQSAAPGTDPGALEAFTIRVTDPQGRPLQGLEVDWSVTPAGAATLRSGTTSTGADGVSANFLATLNQTGTVTITASVFGGGIAEFTLAGSFTADPALTENERAVARALDSECAALRNQQDQGAGLTPGGQDLLATCDALARGEAGPAGDALRALAPDEVAAQASLIIETSTTHLKNVGVRLVELHNRASGFSVAGLALNFDGQILPGAALASLLPGAQQGGAASAGDGSLFSRLSAFVNGTVSFGDKDTTDREPGFDFDTQGVTAGVDYRFTDSIVAGGAFGYTSIDADLDGTSGNLDTHAYSFSLYGTYYLENLYVDGVVSFGRYDYDYRRGIVFDGVNQTAEAEPDATEYAISVGGGYEFNRGSFNFGPYVRLDYIEAEIDGYREDPSNPGAPGAGLVLDIDDQDVESLVTTLGGQVFYAISTRYGIFSPQLRFDWQHQFEDDARVITARFRNGPLGEPFPIRTDSPDRNFFNLGAGVSAQFAAGKAAFIYYETRLGQEDVTQHAFAAGVRIEF